MFRLVTLVATAVVAVLAYRGSRRGKRDDRGPAMRSSLQTWEGEGGGVPATGTRTLAQVPVGEKGTESVLH